MPVIDIEASRLYYELTGPEDAPVVAFSNSLGTTIEMWDAQVAALAGRYRCLRYDTRGHGRSTPGQAGATIIDLADDLAALLDALSIGQVHLVGLSLGGLTAQAVALRHPAKVKSLVLMATAAWFAGEWNERAALIETQGMSAIVEATMQRWFTPAFQTAEAAIAIRQRFLAIAPAGYAECCRVIAKTDLRSDIAAIDKPTLIIAGADDPATPVAVMEDIRSRIDGSELVVLPRASHMLALEREALVNRHLSAFLDAQHGAVQASHGPAEFSRGLANRKAVLGDTHVARSLANAGPFAMPWQDFITRMAWGEIWGDATLSWKTRSLVTLAMMVALNREEEFKLHVRPALKNGVTIDELRSLLLQTGIYAGVPAANGAFRWVKEVLGDELPLGASP